MGCYLRESICPLSLSRLNWWKRAISARTRTPSSPSTCSTTHVRQEGLDCSQGNLYLLETGIYLSQKIRQESVDLSRDRILMFMNEMFFVPILKIYLHIMSLSYFLFSDLFLLYFIHLKNASDLFLLYFIFGLKIAYLSFFPPKWLS